MTVRRAQKADADFIAAAEQKYIDCPWTKAQILDEMDNPQSLFFTAEADGAPIGYVSGYIAADECEIANIAVDESHRRRGVGERLLCSLISAARERGVKKLFLTVRDGNAAATALYVKLGFEAVGRRSGYYKGKDDAIIMLKTL